MSHDIIKPSNLIGCLENKTADSAQRRKRAIVTRPFPSPGGRGLGTRPSPCVSSAESAIYSTFHLLSRLDRNADIYAHAHSYVLNAILKERARHVLQRQSLF